MSEADDERAPSGGEQIPVRPVGPQWIEISPGVEGLTIQGADGQPVHVLKEVWEFKATVHANLEQNWSAFAATIEGGEVFESRRLPAERRIYVRGFRRLVREDGRVGDGYLVVLVDRQRDVVVSGYIADAVLGKLGNRLHP